MKPKSNLRLLVTMVTFASIVFFLENKRKENRRILNKTDKNLSDGANSVKVSNTDYILFESLSKYLFISLAK